MPAEVVRGFYRRWYVPSNLAVVMVGDFDCDKVVQVGAAGQAGAWHGAPCWVLH